MSDQNEGVIMDSDIKFNCRLLLEIVKFLPKELQQSAFDCLGAIVKQENERLREARLPKD